MPTRTRRSTAQRRAKPRRNAKAGDRIRPIVSKLKRAYPDATCSLNHKSPLELLVSTILSAQCTDERVNKVTKDLFKQYGRVEDYAAANPAELEKDIKSTGFYRNKTKSIIGMAQAVLDQHDGQIPDTMEELVCLPGVGRKTANVVLGNAFGVAAGVVVDTHVARISTLLGLTNEKDPKKIERDLIELVPRRDWILFPHLMIQHGRVVCIARRPKCADCALSDLCPSSSV